MAGTLAAGMLAAVLATSGAAAASQPQDPSRPVANADAYRVYSGGQYVVDVLENDDTTLLSGADPTLCGVSVDDGTQQALFAEIDRTDPSKVSLVTDPLFSGVVRFTYDACQGEQRATGTVTLTVERLDSPTVAKKERRRAQITATNPNTVPLTILWASNQGQGVDGQREVPAGGRITIGVQRTRVFWVAYVRDQGAVVVVGDGTVDQIKRRR